MTIGSFFKYFGSAVLAIAIIVAAFAAGISTGASVPDILQPVLRASGWASGLVSGAGTSLALGIAIAAGAVAAFNPCGFVMLPTYLTLYVSDPHGAEESGAVGLFKQVGRGVIVSIMVGLGFLVLFGGFGVLFALGLSGIRQVAQSALPWIGLGLGVVIAVLGGYLLAGGKLYSSLAQDYAGRVGNPQQRSLRGYFFFGVSYALASLSCTLPIFLAVIGVGTADSFLESFIRFAAYAGGMAAVISIITLSISLLKGILIKPMRSILPYLGVTSAIFLLAVGAYLIFYWLTEGMLANTFNI